MHLSRLSHIFILIVIHCTLIAESWDGPYVKKAQSGYTAQWVNEEGKVFSSKGTKKLVGPKDASVNVVYMPSKNVPIKTVYRAPKIAAISDIHGQNSLALDILQKHKVIDKNSNWNFGKGVLIVVGDIMDRGPEVMETMWLVHRWTIQARKAGGAVAVIIGNHEALVLDGQLGYLNTKYNNTAKALGTSYEKLFTNDYVLGKWLRSLPLMVKINDSLFVHGGVSPEVMAKGLTMEQVNQITFDKYKNEKVVSKDLQKVLSSLIWYRGYFAKEKGCPDSVVTATLKAYKAKRIIVGHTSHKEVVKRYDGKVIGVDSSIKNGKKGEILLWEAGKWTRGLSNGERLPL